jgi:uncharacterized protein
MFTTPPRPLLPALLLALLIAPACNRVLPRNPPANILTGTETPQATPCAIPVPNTFVTDNARALHEREREELERKLSAFKAAANIDFAVLFVETTPGQEIFSYSLALARCWGVGGKNPDHAGILLVVAIRDRKWYIQISKVLEQVLTNPEVGKIGEEMVPDFKKANYGAGVNKTVDKMIKTLAPRRGFSMPGG